MVPVLPEVSFASYNADEILGQLITGYEAAAGRSLAVADPIRAFLSSIAAAIIQERFLLDDSAKNVLLKYARGEFLDCLGDLVGCFRLDAGQSTCNVLFTLAVAPGVGNTVTIPAGTRVTKSGSGIFWITNTDLAISGMDGTGTIATTCDTPGAATNDYSVGEISVLVDPIAEVQSVSNSTATVGGADVESDDNYRERIQLAPTSFSTAGSRDSYKYWARSASASIVDVGVEGADPGCVDVYVLLANGALPDPEMIDAVDAILSADTVRPLTDNVTVKAPGTVNFTVDVSYYISSDNESQLEDIKAAVEAAVNTYASWQVSKIKRDVNPSELTRLMMNAGAKRVVITSPAYAAVSATQVAHLSAPITVTYSGLENE